MAVLGIGNALVDILLQIQNDQTLQDLGLPKGAMEMIDEKQMISIQKSLSYLSFEQVPGGSVCNTIRALSRLGIKAGYIGKVGNDHFGQFYVEEIKKAGVEAFVVKTNGISGVSTVLISPDGERTMATYLGPAPTLTPDDVSMDFLSGYEFMYVEGYLLVNEELVRSTLDKAKKAGLKIVLDLSNFNIVNGFKPLIEEIVPEYVNILLSNESEAEAFTGLKAEEAIGVISQMVDISVVTLGKKGALIAGDDTIVRVEAEGDVPIDTTGAGDNFAAGFLFGQAMNLSLEKSGKIGSLLAGYVIQEIGPQITDPYWGQIKLKVEDILRQ